MRRVHVWGFYPAAHRQPGGGGWRGGVSGWRETPKVGYRAVSNRPSPPRSLKQTSRQTLSASVDVESGNEQQARVWQQSGSEIGPQRPECGHKVNGYAAKRTFYRGFALWWSRAGSWWSEAEVEITNKERIIVLLRRRAVLC